MPSFAFEIPQISVLVILTNNVSSRTNRDDWIRTSGPFVPNEVRYQAALHPVEKIANLCHNNINNSIFAITLLNYIKCWRLTAKRKDL